MLGLVSRQRTDAKEQLQDLGAACERARLFRAEASGRPITHGSSLPAGQGAKSASKTSSGGAIPPTVGSRRPKDSKLRGFDMMGSCGPCWRWLEPVVAEMRQALGVAEMVAGGRCTEM